MVILMPFLTLRFLRCLRFIFPMNIICEPLVTPTVTIPKIKALRKAKSDCHALIFFYALFEKQDLNSTGKNSQVII